MDNYFLLLVMTIIGSFAAFFLKSASGSKQLKDLLSSKYLYLGGLLYFLSAIINIYVLHFLDYSVVLPLTSITYIWTMIISRYKLNENISNKKIIGIGFIIIGAIFVAV